MLDCFLREQLHGKHPCVVDLVMTGRARLWRGEKLEGPRLDKEEKGRCTEALCGAGLLILPGRVELKRFEA